MMLIVFFSSRISPRASTVIFCERSPLATEVVTLAMFRTCVVRLAARTLTLSVRSFQVPEASLGAAPLCPARHLRGERPELIDHHVDRALELEDLALGVDRDLLREVA